MRSGITKLYTRKEVCTYLKISPATLTRLMSNGTIKAVKIGGSVRFTQEALTALTNQQTA